MPRHLFCAPALALLAAVLSARAANAAWFSNFNEAGTTVNGYQDDFSGATLDPAWLEVDVGNNDPNPMFVPSSSMLLMNPAQGDPNKLLYNPATPYNNTNQNVLALVRVARAGSGDGFRGGVSAASAATGATAGQGFNLHFRNHDPVNPHLRLLDDARAWGPRTIDAGAGGDTWTAGEWKWLRLVTSGTTVQGKIWEAGTTPEPAAFDVTWTRGGRTGLAGLATNSLGATGILEVDYVLIQAAGLPSIQVVPEPAAAGLLALASVALLARSRGAARR